MDKVKIGYLIYEDHREPIYLTKHSWDCNWYWGFGYLGNENSHFHMSGVIPNQSDEHKLVFENGAVVKLLDKYDGWKIMEFYEEAYILKRYAELLYLGTAMITKGIIPEDKEKAFQINQELEKILDYIWEYLKTGEKNE